MTTYQKSDFAFGKTRHLGPRARALISKLSPDPLTINVAGRQYKMDFAGLVGTPAQLGNCEAQARS